MKQASAARDAVARYRRNMRRAGFRLVQLWVPDTRDPRFAKECRRQSRVASRHPLELAVLRDLEALHDSEGWTA